MHALFVRYLFVISTSVIDCLGRFVPEMTYYVSSGTLNVTKPSVIVCSRAQIGMIVGTVISCLIIISIIIVIVVVLCRQRALAEKKKVERVAQIIGATEVNCSYSCTESLCNLCNALVFKHARKIETLIAENRQLSVLSLLLLRQTNDKCK